MTRLPHDGPLVLLHIQKTGGTSLHSLLRKRFSAHEVCPERLRNLRSYDREQLTQYRFFSGHLDRADVEYIPGPVNVVSLFREPRARILSHYYFWRSHRVEVIEKENLGGPKRAKQLRLLPFLRHRGGGNSVNFHNHQVRMLLGRRYAGPNGEFLFPDNEVVPRAVEFVDSMCAVGILEQFDDSVRQIYRALNMPPPETLPHAMDHRTYENHPRLEPVEREELTTEIEAELDRLTRFDRQLYEHVRRTVSRSRQSTAKAHQAA
jgi:hypothetical protein